jgi:TonB family protein
MTEARMLSHRSALLARRHATFLAALDAAEAALTRGAGDDALQAAVEAGLLEPDNDRVIAILDQAQDALGADRSAVSPVLVARQSPRSVSAGPASWSLGTPSLGAPRPAASVVSVVATVAGHVLALAFTFVALAKVVPAINLTQFHILHLPAALIDSAPPPDVFDSGQSDESELGENTGVLDVVTVTNLADLADLPIELGRRGTGGGGRGRLALFRRTRASGGTELPPGVEPATAAMFGGADRPGLGEVNRAPRLIRAVPPVYPPAAFDRGLEGVMTVTLQVVLNRDGRVEQTSIVQGAPELHQAAQDAVSQWKYSPAMRSGQRVPVIFIVSITFDFH